MKKTLLYLFFVTVFFCSSIQVLAQQTYSLDLTIEGFDREADVFKSSVYGWTFVVSKNSPKRYFYRPNDGTPFTEFFDPDGLLTNVTFVDGFNANPYKGFRYGSLFIPTANGFVAAKNMYNPENGSIIKVNFLTNTIFEVQSATIPLKYISRIVLYDNDVYFSARTTDAFVAIYKLVDNGWETTNGNQFFDDYEVGSQYIYDEKNDRLVLSTGITWIKDGVWSYKDGNYAELGESGENNEYDIEKFVGFIHSNPLDRGTPVFLGHYLNNDQIGSELYRLDGATINLVADASPNKASTSVYGTVFNDYADLLFDATIMDKLNPNNTYSSEKGRGIYKLNTNNNTLERLTHSTDNIYSVSYALRTKDGIYMAAKSSNNATDYNIYLYKDGNPILEKIDLNGEFLSNKAGLFVHDDILYFHSNKGFCKITNKIFEDFYKSSDYWGLKNDEILMVEDNKIYFNFYYDQSFRILSLQSLGIKEVSQNDKAIIYPNPSNDYIKIQLNNDIHDSTYTIIDQLGKNVLSGKLASEISVLDITKLSKGVYFLKIGNQNQEAFKIIKK